MSSANDWEALLNGVFGSGGRLNTGAGKPAPEKKPEKPAPQKPAPSRRLDTDSLSALQRNSRALDEALKKQAEEIAAMGDALTTDMKREGLLEEAPAKPAAADPSWATPPLYARAFPAWPRLWARRCWASPLILKSSPWPSAAPL